MGKPLQVAEILQIISRDVVNVFGGLAKAWQVWMRDTYHPAYELHLQRRVCPQTL